MKNYRAEFSHRIGGQQVNRVKTFWMSSKKKAIGKFRSLRKADSTIQEARLFRQRDESLVDEYVGYI